MDANTPYRLDERAWARLVVMGPNEIARICMVAGLAGVEDVRAEACSDLADLSGPPPELVLLQDDPAGSFRMAARLRLLGGRWPATKVIVVTDRPDASMETCRAFGVRGCLPSQAQPHEIVAAIRSVRAGMVVYPVRLLARPAAPQNRS